MPRIRTDTSALRARAPVVTSAAALAAALPLLGSPAVADEESVAPYVPTVREDVELMMNVAGVGPGDYLIDLGSGDGRIVLSAARRGAFGHGVELEPDLVERAERSAKDAGLEDRTVFVQGDVFEADIADATVVSLYLFPEANLRLRPKLLAELEPGTRVVSNSFRMGEWRPDVHDTSARSSGGILMWIVPADVAGKWTLELAGDAAGAMRIEQRFQEIELAVDAAPGPDAAPAPWRIAGAELRGDRLAFRARRGSRRYTFNGRVDGDRIEGFVHVRSEQGARLMRFKAVRPPAADHEAVPR